MSIYTAGDRTPYTYVVTHLPTGNRYYGARYAKNCTPSDLWVDYFTSSQAVSNLIQQDGRDAFTVSIRKIFTSVAKCRLWEHKFLTKVNACCNTRWINAHNGSSKFYNVSPASPDTKQKMSKVRVGKPKSDTMRQNSMWYYELRFDDTRVEYIKGKVNVLIRLGRKDWETIRKCIQKKKGLIPRANVYIRRMPKNFVPPLFS